MNPRTLFRLGALATLVTAIGITLANLLDFLGAANTVAFVWLYIGVTAIEVFAMMALYVAQARRGGVLTFIGFVLLIIAMLFYLVNSEGRMAAATGFLTQAQLDSVQQISSFVALNAIATWSFILGAIMFGYGTFRTGVFPRWTGILLILVGVTTPFEIPVVEYAWVALSLAAWGGLGWALWTNPRAAE